MSETYIHIGFEKTASTLLQTRIFANLNGFQFLTPPYTQHNEQWNRLQYGDDTQFELSSFLGDHAQKANSDSKLLISDEHLVGKSLHGGMQRTLICDRLQSAFPDAKILIVIRGQFDILKSLHNQWVKSARKGTTTFGEFVWWKKQDYVENAPFTLNNMQFNTNRDYVHLDFLNYHELIKLYKSRFAEVKVVLFETLKSDPGRFFSQIFNFLNISEPAQDIKTQKVNQGIGGKKLAEMIVTNSLKNLPLSRLETKILTRRLTSAIFRKNENEYKTFENPIQDYFKDSNTRLINDYPEVGIQKYPESYRFSS